MPGQGSVPAPRCPPAATTFARELPPIASEFVPAVVAVSGLEATGSLAWAPIRRRRCRKPPTGCARRPAAPVRLWSATRSCSLD